ncbi:MAG: leucyl aminopeptidase [Alphaproteobacteria bacterium]|nr:leucyl aminopeptidase [Alphaproteobacteria bacterium]
MQFALRPASDLTCPDGALAIALGEDAPIDLPASLDPAFRAQLEAVLAAEEFKGKAGASVSVRALGQIDATWVVVVGKGSGSAPDLRLAAGAAGHFAREKGLTRLSFAPGGALSAEAACAVGEGVLDGNYRWDRYHLDDNRKAPLAQVDVFDGDTGTLAALQRGAAISAARSLARDLVNAPPADIYPESIAAAALKLASDRVTVEVWDEARIRQENLVGVIAVGQGSDRPPRFVHMTYTPDVEPVAEVALVGKGVTFDAGGLSIKTSEGMSTMRCDMGGAGAVIGAMSALEALGLPVKVHGIFGAVENLISGSSYKLGDILRYNNGKTVEILNTDAEGRLVLADCLIYACKLPVTHVIDLATLTGAAVVALGEHYTALYADEDPYADALLAAARSSGEGLWRMPLEPLYKELLKGDWSHIKNIGGRMAGSITAGLFLSEFVDGVNWAHLDIAGPAFLSAPERHFTKGATGAGVGTLLYWLAGLGG